MEQEHTAPPAESFVSHQGELARDQIAAAWQLHIEQVHEQLEKGWRDHVARVLDERLAAMEEQFDAELEKRVAERVAEENDRAREAVRRAMSERLNQTARRLEQAEDTQTWASALLDGAAAFASRVLLFSVASGTLQYEGCRSAQEQDLDALRDASLPITDAPAFAGVLDSLDTVIAMAAPGEISQTLAAALGASEDRRVCLLPVLVGRSDSERRVSAILYAEGNGQPLDVNILEVLTALAGATLDGRQAARRVATIAPAGALLGIAPASASLALPVVPDFSRLTREEQEIHARAQRFARVRVAEMRLYQAQAVREGRENSRLYLALRGEMDRGRTQFKHEFLEVPSMVDYFHLELVRTLANDDPSLLGPEYPGPLV